MSIKQDFLNILVEETPVPLEYLNTDKIIEKAVTILESALDETEKAIKEQKDDLDDIKQDYYYKEVELLVFLKNDTNDDNICMVMDEFIIDLDDIWNEAWEERRKQPKKCYSVVLNFDHDN